jgi:type IV secretion system protein VirB10
VVAAGTHILLRLTNAVNTKHASPGDRIYLETAVPVFVNSRMIIPAGSYVNGTVTDAKQAGRVKGKSSLTLQYDSLTLRSGVTRDLRSRPDSVDSRGNLDKTEGRIDGEGNKAGDAGKVAQTTAAGTGIGAIAGGAAGHLGMGAGIGAAGGAVAGLASVFGSRGPEVVLPPGTTMDMILDRDLHYTGDELRMRVQ